MLWPARMDRNHGQPPASKPGSPEQSAPPAPKPDVGAKRDLIRPEEPEAAEPRKPMPDMDPPGQDPDESESA